MKIFVKYAAIFSIIIFLTSGLYADALDRLLKKDFNAQQTIMIRFEVNQRLYSAEAGKFKLSRIRKNRDKIRAMTGKIIPWALMERLEPAEVARIIVYMYRADEAGASFLDAEDLIPLIATMDIPLKDFVLMVQYNRETKRAGIPEEIRQSFLGHAISLKWDGVSILTGGRGLVLARSSKLNINKTASLLLKKLPAKGARTSSRKLISIVEAIIGKSAKKKNSQKIMKNLARAHKAVAVKENSPRVLQNIIKKTTRADSNIRKASKVAIPDRPVENRKIDREAGIIPDMERRVSPSVSNNWETLSKSKLMRTIKPWLGTPYKYGGKTGKGGIDCSGFTRIVLVNKNIGVPAKTIGHGTAKQSKIGRAVSRNKLRAGDLMFFSASPNRSKITHVGIVTSPSTFSHSCNKGVINDKLTKKWWRQRYVKSRRIFKKVTN